MEEMTINKAKEVYSKSTLEEVSASLSWGGSTGDGYWYMAKGFIDGFNSRDGEVGGLKGQIDFLIAELQQARNVIRYYTWRD